MRWPTYPEFLWGIFFLTLAVLFGIGVYGRIADQDSVWGIRGPFELFGIIVVLYIAWLIWQHGQHQAKQEPDREKAITEASVIALLAGLFVAVMVLFWTTAPYDDDEAVDPAGAACASDPIDCWR